MSLITFHQTNRLPKCPSPSAKCLEVETFFRVTGLKYKTVCHANSLSRSNKECPYIELDGTEISQADQIVKEVCEKFAIKIDENLTAEQRALTHLLVCTITYRTSHIKTYFNWEDPIRALKLFDSFQWPVFFSPFPRFIKNCFTNEIKRCLRDDVGFYNSRL